MIRKEVLEGIQKELKKIGLKKMQQRVGKTFFDMDYVVEALYRAFISGKNIILYGPGGFGKSTVVVEFLKQANINYSTIVGYEDMDVEGLLGIPDMDKLLKKSIYETAFDRTPFVNPGILILEEFLDVNPKTAIALKDIITEGGLRQGNKLFESLISSIVICSNRSPYELSIDDSSIAFYKERFPIVIEVRWKEYTYYRYLLYIQKLVTPAAFTQHKESYTILAELAARTSNDKTFVSPRVVKDSVEFLQANNYKIETLQFIDGLDTDIIEEVYAACVYREEEARLTTITYNINQQVELLLDKSDMTSRYIIDSILELKAIIKKINDLTVKSIDNIQSISKLKSHCANAIDILWSKFKPDETDENINQLFEI